MEELKLIDLLYVEDDDETREFVTAILKRRVKSVFTAENGQKGLELYNIHRMPMIITDIKMPVMNGVEMIKRIKPDKTNGPIVLVTTAHKEQELHSALADVHLFKPLDIDSLLETMLSLLLTRKSFQPYADVS
jgi:CheY-like chemotaxis protein